MPKISFSKFKMKPKIETKSVAIEGTDIVLEVPTYLPQQDKADFITFVIEHAIDILTGCVSPIRLESYFSIAIAKWYGQIVFSDKQLSELTKTYDILQTNGIIDAILEAVPDDEYDFLKAIVEETAKDVARYNNSAMGVLASMSANSATMDGQITELLEKVKNAEGLEQLDIIKGVVGKDD